LLVVGSRDYSGAAALAGNGAMRSGAGLVPVATTRSAQAAIAEKTLEEVITRGLAETPDGRLAPEAFTAIAELTGKAQAIGIGCGLGVGDNRGRIRELVLDRKVPAVIDADGLNALAPFDIYGSIGPDLVLTPHEGEFRRLLGAGECLYEDRVACVREFAIKYGVIVMLKGERVLIGDPSGRVVINPTGNSGLGKAGNGDNLTGFVTGCVAQAAAFGVPVFETVVAAVFIAGRAADIARERFGERVMLASDVRECLSAAFAEIEHDD
jgi:NAD(P)H-hydrate epimerase